MPHWSLNWGLFRASQESNSKLLRGRSSTGTSCAITIKPGAILFLVSVNLNLVYEGGSDDKLGMGIYSVLISVNLSRLVGGDGEHGVIGLQ